jgi:hypothetical protein
MLSTDIRDNELKKFRDSAGGPVVAVTIDETSPELRVDTASSTIIYMGEASFSSSESSPLWKIKKIDTSSGVSIKLASNNFDQIWNNRASLTYV